MINKHKFFIGLTLLLFFHGISSEQEKDLRFLSFVADPSSIEFYWKDDKQQIFGNIQNLKSFIESKNQELKFAMRNVHERPIAPGTVY